MITMQPLFRLLVIAALVPLACGMVAARAEDAEPARPAAEPSKEHLDFFEKKIRPLLVARCHSCHGEKKQNGELRLDSFAALMAGGESGDAVIVPGKPDESPLIDAVRYGLREMPPKGNRLPAEEVDLLVEWVRIGA